MKEKSMSNIEEVLSIYDCASVNEKAAQAFLEGERFKRRYEENLRNEEKIGECVRSLDMTTLHASDGESDVERLSRRVTAGYGKYGNVAAVCVYPSLVRKVRECLKVPEVKIAAVSGGFPHAQTFMEVKIAEAGLCIADGADEIDMVLSVGKFLEGNLEECADEITEMKGCVGDKVLKVILETCLLGRLELISEASLLAMVCGADFIKTSTGKEKTGATPEGAWAMCKSIRQFFEREGVKVGFKAAGGIRKIEDAMRYLTIAEMILGKEWIEEGKFRIGTSGLEGF